MVRTWTGLICLRTAFSPEGGLGVVLVTQVGRIFGGWDVVFRMYDFCTEVRAGDEGSPGRVDIVAAPFAVTNVTNTRLTDCGPVW